MVNVEKLLKSIIISSLLVIFWAIPGHFGHDLTCLLFTGSLNNSCWDNTTLAFRPELRAFSTLGQPNWLGAYLAVAFFIGMYYFLKNQISKIKDQNDRSKIKNIIWANYLTPVYLFLNFSMILFTRSRSAVFAVLVGLVLFISYYWFFVKTNIKKLFIILLIITVVPILFFKTGIDRIDKYLTLATYKNIFIKKTVSPSSRINDQTSTNVTESFDIRKIVWQGAWDLSKKYPLFGTGVETFAYSYSFVRPASHNLTSEWDYVYNKAHNEYFNYLATTGFIGLSSYLFLIFCFVVFSIVVIVIPAKAGIQKKIIDWIPFFKGMTKRNNNLTIEQSNNETILVICLLISYFTILITNFFGFSTTTIQLFFFLIPAFIITSASLPSKIYDLSSTKLSLLQKFLIFLLLSATVYLLFSITVYYLADVNYSYGTKYAKVEDQQKAASYFEKALKLRQEPIYEDRLSSSLAYLSAIVALQDQKDLAKQLMALSDSYNQKLVQVYPKNVFYWKTRAKNMYYFYQATGKDNELLQGVEALKTARKLYPTDPKIPYSLALYYTTLYDSAKNNLNKQNWSRLSLLEIDKTIKLKSNYREAYLFKGQLLKKHGKVSEAKKVFEYMLENFDTKDEEVLKELQSL